MRNKVKKQKNIKKALLGISDKLDKTNGSLGEIQKNTKQISKNSNSKFNKVTVIIGLIIAVITAVISSISLIPDFFKKPEIYLYSNYKTVMVGQNVDLTSTMNFEAESVYVTAYLDSGRQDTLEMDQNNKNEWSKKVYFEEKGIHEIVVIATTYDGKEFKDSIKINVE